MSVSGQRRVQSCYGQRWVPIKKETTSEEPIDCPKKQIESTQVCGRRGRRVWQKPQNLSDFFQPLSHVPACARGKGKGKATLAAPATGGKKKLNPQILQKADHQTTTQTEQTDLQHQHENGLRHQVPLSALDKSEREAKKAAKRALEWERKSMQKAESETKTALEWARYSIELDLDHKPEQVLSLDVHANPALSTEDCNILNMWSARCLAAHLPNGLIDLAAITRDALASFSGWSFIRDVDTRGNLICNAVSHLREQVDVRNRWKLKNPEVRQSMLDAWHAMQPASELAGTIEASFGITGYSFAQALSPVLLVGGVAEWKRALACLRKTPRDERIEAMENCVRCADETSLTKLVYLARENVAIDWRAEQNGVDGEASVEHSVQNVGLEACEYLTEEQQRSIQCRIFGNKIRFPTPDFLFRRPVCLAGTSGHIRWLDAKNTTVVPGCTMVCRVRKLQTQALNCMQCFGPGAILWLKGYPQSLPEVQSVFFFQLDPAQL